MPRIILPSEVKQTEDLRKTLRSMVVDPRVRKFEQLRAEGMDSETAMALSDLREMDTAAQAEHVLRTAQYDDPMDRIRWAATTETQGALRSVGQATGAAVGSAMSMVILRTITQYSGTLMLGGTLVAGGIVATLVGKTVAGTLGKAAAVVAITNVVMASGILALAIGRRR